MFSNPYRNRFSGGGPDPAYSPQGPMQGARNRGRTPPVVDPNAVARQNQPGGAGPQDVSFRPRPAPTTQDVSSNPGGYAGTSFDPNLQASLQVPPAGNGATFPGQNPSNEGGVNIGGTYFPPVYGGNSGYNGPLPASAYDDNPYWGPIAAQRRSVAAAEQQFRQQNPGATAVPYGTPQGGMAPSAGGYFSIDPTSGQANWMQNPVGGANRLNYDPLRGFTSAASMASDLATRNPGADAGYLQSYANWAMGGQPAVRNALSVNTPQGRDAFRSTYGFQL